MDQKLTDNEPTVVRHLSGSTEAAGPGSLDLTLPLEAQLNIVESVFKIAQERLSYFTTRNLEPLIPSDRKAYLFLGLYPDEEIVRLPDIFDKFVKASHDKLAFLYHEYEKDEFHVVKIIYETKYYIAILYNDSLYFL